MHELPGETLGDKDIARYESDNASLFAGVESRVNELLQSKKTQDRIDAINVIPLLPEERRGVYIATVLADENINMSVRELIVKQIPFVPTLEQKALYDTFAKKLIEIIERMHVTNFEEFNITELIGKVSEPARSVLYEKVYAKLDEVISQEKDGVSATTLQSAKFLPPPLITKLVSKGLENGSLLMKMEASNLLRFVEEEKRSELIARALEQPHIAVQRTAASVIFTAPITERKTLMERAFQDDMPDEIKEVAAPGINTLEEKDRVFFIEKLLKSESRTLRVDGVFAIELAPVEERARLIYVALQDKETRVRASAVYVIVKAHPDEYKNLLEFAYTHTSGTAQEMAKHDIARYEQGEFGKNILIENETRDTPLPPEDSELFTYLQEKVAQFTPLYMDQPEKFGRKAFAKTGSGTTLLDTVPGNSEKSLRGKAVVRHIELPAYASWKQAYEADAFWKEKGFSYVPIEPIVGVRFSDKNIHEEWDVDVFTRVLGVNAYAWIQESNGVYEKHINEQIDAIKRGLDEMRVVHGHPHQRNFCLVFEKNSEGKPDITKPPRVYIIDFDRAVSSSKK